jgi:glycosyltransferase involved in cell wall biosynthesis
MTQNLPNTAFVIFSSGAFGGAEKRFTNLFMHLQNNFPGKFHFIINPLMYQHIQRVFGNINRDNIHVIEMNSVTMNINPDEAELPVQYNDIIPDPFDVHKSSSLLRKYYWFYKNKRKQKKIFRQIEELRKKENINVFIGIFAGGLPLMFYIEQNDPEVKIIFSDMDSWFSDVLSDTKKLWYRKYYSFNCILEHADKVDFLSPYIAEGVKKLGVKIQPERVSIAPCSFIDYSKCKIGSKQNFQIGFASRLEPDKNPMLYLDAAREVLKEYPEIKFHLLGEGSLVSEINEYISANGLEQSVNFTFHKNPPEIFSETTVFVSLQSGTNYPSQSVLEAMACGNAIVASDTGDTRLFVNPQNGVLVQLNTDSVASAIKKLIADNSAAKTLGLQAAKFAKENHTIEKVSDYYLGLINNFSKQDTNE